MKLLFLTLLPFSLLSQTSDTILTGSISEAVFNDSWAAEWKLNEQTYRPDSLLVNALKNESSGKELRFKIYLGTWCDDSKIHVPAWLKLNSILLLDAEYVGVNRAKECPLSDCSSWNIGYLPTIVVLKDGKEIGRMVETPKKSIEADLLEILEMHR